MSRKLIDNIEIRKVRGEDLIAVIKQGKVVANIPFNILRLRNHPTYETEMTASKLWSVLGRMPTRTEEQMLHQVMNAIYNRHELQNRGADPTVG